MATAKKPRALIEAEKRIVELEQKLTNETAAKEVWYKQAQEAKANLDGVHDVLDDLGIRRFKDDNKYYELPLAVRLFAWSMKMATKEKI